MKHALLIFGVLTANCLLAIAGPTALPEGKAVIAPPQPRPPCDWSGFYIGANIGGAFDRADLTLDLGGDWSEPSEAAYRTHNDEVGSRDLDANGVVAGGFIGYNFQWNHWVLGAEADGDFVGLRDSFGSLQVVDGDFGPVPESVRQSFKTHYRVTLGPRLGYAWDRVLLYATGGLAIGDIDFSQQITEGCFCFHEGGSTHDTRAGWTVGGGLQYCITGHWSARVEYRFTDLGCADFSSVATDPAFTGHHEACLDFHSVTAGLAYKF